MIYRHHPAVRIPILAILTGVLLGGAAWIDTLPAGAEGLPKLVFPTPGGTPTPDTGTLPPGFDGFTPARPAGEQRVTVEGPGNPINLVEIDAPGEGSLVLDPVVVFQNPPLGEVELLAGFHANGKFTLAQEWPTGIVFESLQAGAPLVGYGSQTIEAAPFEWAPEVFDHLGAIDLDIARRRQVFFFLAIMPPGRMDLLQVGAFQFKQAAE